MTINSVEESVLLEDAAIFDATARCIDAWNSLDVDAVIDRVPFLHLGRG